jgi:cytochrome c biogenesis protein CcdA
LSGGGTWLLPLVGVAALIDSINPCAFGILILTIAFLFSVGQSRAGILKIGGTYILGIFTVYILIGLGILQVLHLFNTPHFMARVGAALLIAVGAIDLLGGYFPRFPIKLSIPQSAHGKIAELMNKASIPTAFFLGVLVGLCEFPCTGGPYLMVLGLLNLLNHKRSFRTHYDSCTRRIHSRYRLYLVDLHMQHSHYILQ